MPIFEASDFTTNPIETPSSTEVKGSGGAVTIILSTGITETVFDSLDTALRCLAFMNSRGQYYLQASDDIMIVNVSSVKLLVLETTMLNQKLLNSYNFIYSRKNVMAVHRNLATINNLTEALISVGYKKSTLTPFQNNYDLETNLPAAERPGIKIVDYHYVDTVSNSNTGSVLLDTTSIVYGG